MASRSHSRPRVVIIGNGGAPTAGPFQPPVSSVGLSRFIDRSDVVIRMNDLNNLGAPGIGNRTDILAVNNSGLPGRRHAQGMRIAAPILRGLREILIPVPRSEIALWAADPGDDPARVYDWSAGILAHQGWGALAVSWIGDSVTAALTADLVRRAGRACLPSTGVRVIAYVLSEPRFREHDRYLIDFHCVGGWEGHAWAAERGYIESQIAAGRLRTVPRSRLGLALPRRLDHALARALWPEQRRPSGHAIRASLAPTSALR